MRCQRKPYSFEFVSFHLLPPEPHQLIRRPAIRANSTHSVTHYGNAKDSGCGHAVAAAAVATSGRLVCCPRLDAVDGDGIVGLKQLPIDQTDLRVRAELSVVHPDAKSKQAANPSEKNQHS